MDESTADWWRIANDRAKEIARLRAWVNDLQSGMYVNCVYCGHRYGPQKDTPVTQADMLKEHIAQCPKHPLAKAMAEIARLRARIARLEAAIREQLDDLKELREIAARARARVRCGRPRI